MIYWIIVVSIMIILIIVLILLWDKNGDRILWLWNQTIKSECDGQDQNPFNGIPSYYEAGMCKNQVAGYLDKLLYLNHNEILKEVADIIKLKEDKTPNKDVIRTLSIEIRKKLQWSKDSNYCPTLKSIVTIFPEVDTLYVMVLYPGASIVEQHGKLRVFQKYQYGLKLPEHKITGKLVNYDIQWREKTGHIWDSTLSYSIQNYTPYPKIIIFADIYRPLSIINKTISYIIYGITKKTNIDYE